LGEVVMVTLSFDGSSSARDDAPLVGFAGAEDAVELFSERALLTALAVRSAITVGGAMTAKAIEFDSVREKFLMVKPMTESTLWRGTRSFKCTWTCR
jgi:hypothetical protein